MKINDDGDKNDAQAKLDAEIADLSDFDDAEADMSDAEIAALEAAQAKLAADLDDDLDMIDADLSALKDVQAKFAADLDMSDAEIAREILTNLRKAVAIGDSLLARVKAKKQPN
jgi:hypothetical protein